MPYAPVFKAATGQLPLTVTPLRDAVVRLLNHAAIRGHEKALLLTDVYRCQNTAQLQRWQAALVRRIAEREQQPLRQAA